MIINMLITDEQIVYVEKENLYSKINKIGSLKLPDSVISRGRIIDKRLFDKALNTLKKSENFSTNDVNLVLQNNTVKVIKIEMKDLVGIDLSNESKVNEFVIKYLNHISNIDDLDMYTFVHHKYADFINVFLIENDLLNAFTISLIGEGFNVISTDLNVINAINEEMYINPDNEKIICCNAILNKTSISLSIFEHAQLVTSFYVPILEGNIDDYEMKLQDEIYRLCNYYHYNINDGKKEVQIVRLYPMDDELKPKLDNILLNNLTGVDNIIIKQENNSVYPISCKYNIALGGSLVSKNLRQENLVDFLYKEAKKETVSEPLVYISTILICLLLLYNFAYSPLVNLENNIIKTENNISLLSNRIDAIYSSDIFDYISDDSITQADISYDSWKDDYLEKLDDSEDYKTNLTDIIKSIDSINVDGVVVDTLDNDGDSVYITFKVTSEASYIEYINKIYDTFEPTDFEESYTEGSTCSVLFSIIDSEGGDTNG